MTKRSETEGAKKHALIGKICPKCGHPFREGDAVQTRDAGKPLETEVHVDCDQPQGPPPP